MEPSRVHTFYAELPFSLIGSLIGREGTRLKHMVSQDGEGDEAKEASLKMEAILV